MSKSELDSEKKLSEESIIAMIQHATTEIDTYRRRQISTFREFIIVQALITFGLSQLGIESPLLVMQTRLIAGIICLIAGISGFWMIMLYKMRIHYIRDRRDELVKRLSSNLSVYYPTKKQGESVHSFFALPTSTIYGVTLIIVGVLACFVNLLLGGVL